MNLITFRVRESLQGSDVKLTMYSRVEKLVLMVPLVRGPLVAYMVTI